MRAKPSRRKHLVILVAVLVGCSGGSTGPGPSNPPPPPPPPPPPAGGVIEIERTIPASGGTLTVADPRHPYDGLVLTVGNGAFATTGTWRLAVDSTATLSGLPPGAQQAGPAITLSTDQARAGRLLTLRVPVSRVAGTTTVLVMRDPARNVIDVPMIIAADDQSITVAATHFNPSLLLGPSPAAAAGLAALSLGEIFPVRLPTDVLRSITAGLFSALRDLWPAPDAGSSSYPDGHGPAAAILSMLSQFQPASNALGALVKPMGAPGLLADTAAFATLLRSSRKFQELSGPLSTTFAEVAAIFAGLPPAVRDSLTWLNLRVALAVTRRPQLVVMQKDLLPGPPTLLASEWALAVGSVGNAVSILRSTAPAAPATLTIGAGGWEGPLFRNVLDAPSRPAGAIFPVGGSFLLPFEAFVDIYRDLVASRSESGEARAARNRSLALEAAMADLRVRWQESTDAAMSLVSGNVLVARDDSASIRIDCAVCPGGSADLALVDTVSRTEIGRSRGGGRIRMRGLGGLGFATLPAGVLASLFGQGLGQIATMTAGSAERVLAPIRLFLTRLPFALDPVSQTVTPEDTVRFTMRVAPQPGQQWSIEWDWGDGSAPEVRTADSTAAHQYAGTGAFVVRATLRVGTDAPLPVVARARGTVTVSNTVVWKLTSLTGPSSGEPAGEPEELGRIMADPDLMGAKLTVRDIPGFRVLDFTSTLLNRTLARASTASTPSQCDLGDSLDATRTKIEGRYVLRCGWRQGSSTLVTLLWIEVSATITGSHLRGTWSYYQRLYSYSNETGFTPTGMEVASAYRFEGERLVAIP